MNNITCFTTLIILSLVSCTATTGQTPTSTPVLSATATNTLPPTTSPTNTPEATQTEINYAVQPLVLKDQNELIDTRINSLVWGCIKNPISDWSDWIKGLKYDGFTRTRFTLNFSDGPAVDFAYASIEEELPVAYVDLYRQMKDIGIKTRYSLSFWDMAYRKNGGMIHYDRLSTEEETNRYLAYVKMVATSLKGLVDGYEYGMSLTPALTFTRELPQKIILKWQGAPSL